MRPSCRIIGVQSEHAPSMKQSLEKKEIIKLQDVSTIADGIAVKTPGTLTYELCRQYVDEVVTVSEEVLSGGNIDVNLLSKIIDLGLMKTGRKAVINMNVMDKPGNLSRMIELISRTGANIISVNHNRIQNAMLFNQCRVGVIIETNDAKHIADVLAILKNNGYDPHLVEHV